MSTETAEHFIGHENRECGEHRTVGPHRAWCFDCSEWCSPAAPCARCEAPMFRAAVTRLLTAQGRMLDRWAEADDDVRRELWQRLHAEADRVRDVMDVLEGIPTPPSPVSAATGETDGTTEAQEARE